MEPLEHEHALEMQAARQIVEAPHLGLESGALIERDGVERRRDADNIKSGPTRPSLGLGQERPPDAAPLRLGQHVGRLDFTGIGVEPAVAYNLPALLGDENMS